MNTEPARIKVLLFALGILQVFSIVPVSAQAPGDERWDYRFGLAGVPGSEGIAMAMAFDGTNIFIGGSFESIGQAVAKGVARFDGRQMQVLPEGPQQELPLINVMAMAMFQGRLWVGGFFQSVAGMPAGGLACWDGTNWSVPGGTAGEVYALHLDKESLLVAGNFWLPEGTNPVALARWNGREWSVLNSDFPPCTNDVACINNAEHIAVVRNDIYALLRFSWVNDPYGAPQWILARCDSSNHWFNMPAPNGDTNGLGYYNLATFQGQLVAGGNFANSANPAIRNVAFYDGSAWQPLGQGLEFPVCALAANNHFLYAAHRAVPFGQVPAYAVSRWDGTNWSSVGTNRFRTDAPQCIFSGPDDSVYLTGAICNSEDAALPGLARWNGRQWQPLLQGAYHGLAGYTGSASCLAQHQGSLYVGGLFSAAGAEVTEGIARWDGTNWHSVATPLQGQYPAKVGTLVSSGTSLFAGGSFTNMGEVAASNVACWNGSAWTPLGEGLPKTPSTLAWWNESLYAGGWFVGGLFSSSSNAPDVSIARWTGSVWESLGEQCDNRVMTLVEWRNGLYAGGTFTTAGGVVSPGLARWDGSTWHEVGQGLAATGSEDDDTPTVTSMVGNDEGLYVAGNFFTLSEPSVTNLARWDGTNWHAVGDAWPGTVRALAIRNHSLFAAGYRTNSLGEYLENIQRWDGTNWTALGRGVTKPGNRGRPYALLATENEVYVGGLFTQAGGKPSVGVARWIENPRLLLELQRPAPGPSLRLRATSDPGLRFDLEASSGLSGWEKIGTGEDGPAEWNFGPTTNGSSRFFRAVARP